MYAHHRATRVSVPSCGCRHTDLEGHRYGRDDLALDRHAWDAGRIGSFIFDRAANALRTKKGIRSCMGSCPCSPPSHTSHMAVHQGQVTLSSGRVFLFARYLDWSVTTPVLAPRPVHDGAAWRASPLGTGGRPYRLGPGDDRHRPVLRRIPRSIHEVGLVYRELRSRSSPFTTCCSGRCAPKRRCAIPSGVRPTTATSSYSPCCGCSIPSW